MWPLWAHVSVRTWVPLHALGPVDVWWPHHALRGPLVVLAHLSRRHEWSLHSTWAHGGAHIVLHLLRGHGLREALRRRGHGPSLAREGGHWSLLALWRQAAISLKLIHSLHLHLLRTEQRHYYWH